MAQDDLGLTVTPTSTPNSDKPAFLRGRSSIVQPKEQSTLNTLETKGGLPPRDPEPDTDVLDYIKDGDTVKLESGRTVRLLGIDTPETAKKTRQFKQFPDLKLQAEVPAQPFANAAKAELIKLFAGNKNVALQFDTKTTDKYGRTLAHVLSEDGTDIQQVLLRKGLAKVLTIEPNTNMDKLYKDLETQAKRDKVGQWQSEAVPVGHIPAYLRTKGYHDKEKTAPTGIWDNTLHDIEDYGFGVSTAAWIRELNEADQTDDDFRTLQADLPKLIEDLGLHSSNYELLIDKSINIDHAKQLADRLLRLQRRAPGREVMGNGAMLLSGLQGFALDPTNWIPGALVLKSSGAMVKAFPQVAARLAKSSPTLTGKTASWVAFGAAEEAFRASPRLMADPTYATEAYLMNVAMGGAFGVAMTKGIPALRWSANKTLGTGYKTASKGTQAAFEKAQESMHVRTAMNVMADVVKGGTRKVRHKKITDKLDELDTAKVARTARDRAREQVDLSKQQNVIKRTFQSLHDRLTKPEADLTDPELLTGFEKSLKKILKTSDKSERIQDVAAKFEAASAKIKALSGELKNQAAKAKPAKEKLATGSAPKTPVKTPKQNFTDTLKTVEKLRQSAQDALKESKSPVLKDAVLAVEATALSATRAIEGAAARQGIKIIRRPVSQVKTRKAISERLSAVLPKQTIDKFKVLTSILKVEGNLSEIFTAISDHLKLPRTDNSREAVMKWVLADPKQVTKRSVILRDDITRVFTNLHEELQLKYTGHPNDHNFIELKKLIRDQQDELESLMDWAGYAHDKNFADLNKMDSRWAMLSKEYEESMTPEVRKEIHKLFESKTQNAISHQFGKLTQSLAAQMMRTKVILAEWQALNIFELPQGTGGLATRHETAAILAEVFQRPIQNILETSWRDMMEAAAKDMGKGRWGRLMLQNKNPNTGGNTQQLARMVMREVNARQMGTKLDSPTYIKEFADKLEIANKKLYDMQRDHGIEGITGANRMSHYLRQTWRDGAILDMIDNTNVGRSGFIELVGKSLHSRAKGSLSKQESKVLAETILELKVEAMNKPQIDSRMLRTDNLSGSMASIEDIVLRLENTGHASEIKNILNWVKQDIGGTPGYIHKRNINLDYSTTITKNGQTVSVLDLLDNDVVGTAVRYTKEASGRSAISKASGGKLNSETAIEDLIKATGQQANDIGTHVNTKNLRNAYRVLMGLPYDGQLPMDWRKIRDAVALAGMSGLGESQIAEWGLAINRGTAGLFSMNQLASATTGRIKQWQHIKLTDSQKNNLKFMEELQEHGRFYEDMHIVARQNVHFDARESQHATSILSKGIDKFTGGSYRPVLQYLQTRYTGYGAVRTMEEQNAMASMMQDAMKKVRGLKSSTSDLRFKDVGVRLDILKKYLNNNTITLRPNGNIETLNMHRWSKADQVSTAVWLQRHVGQQVQKAFTGEVSPMMQNPKVAMLMQFRSYPMLAAEKQMGRNMMFADKEAAMGITLNAASSAAARVIRYYSLALALPADKREAYLEHKFANDFTHDSAAYMGIVGMMVQNYDLVQDLGFGSESSFGDQLPVINWADNALQAVKSANPLQETIDERDVANIHRGAPLGTILYMNALQGIIRNMMETDDDDIYQSDTALQRN